MNISIGVLGHVDSGKTSFCRMLSTIGSTAAFDSNPQSIERGITLDLGFSSFNIQDWNFTLVDCPGHSSLIRTVIGGSQIMDIMLLIVDINKGMQPQTAECLILAQITSNHLLVLLNKVDLIPENERSAKILKVSKLMNTVLSKTKFVNAPIIPISTINPEIGVKDFKEALFQKVQNTEFIRDTESPFLMAIDHCFSKKGQGTILTGTILQGHLKINDVIEIPKISETRKVKSIQSFRIAKQEAFAGDRCGICVPGLDSSLVERTVISSPKLIKSSIRVGIISINKIKYFKNSIISKRRYHISMGYDTITAKITLFKPTKLLKAFDMSSEYEYVESIGEDEVSETGSYFAVAEFDTLGMSFPGALLIGSDLQSNVTCRLAFYGNLEEYCEDKGYLFGWLPTLRILRRKQKQGSIDRIQSSTSIIVKGFSKRETSVEHLIGLKIQIPIDEESEIFYYGRIQGRFGQTNKLRAELDKPIDSSMTEKLKTKPVYIKFATNYFKKPGNQKTIIQ